jgi:hypothetical protein
MNDWVKKLDEYLRFASYEVLGNTGMISHDEAVAKAKKEYEKYAINRMEHFESDFDREIKKLLADGKKGKDQK